MLRARQGRPFNVEVWNDTADEDIVHWHGLHIPSEVDGAYEEGTPGVPPRGGRRRYTFVPDPAGTRWYHSHNHAGNDLKRSTYTGQFGMLVVEGAGEPGAYDQEVPLLLHEWEPHFTTRGPRDVEFKYHSINGKMLGGGEPIRVRQGQRVLFRIVNASATLQHQLALPGHQFQVVALDGNPVPNPIGRADRGPRARGTRGRAGDDEPAGCVDSGRGEDGQPGGRPRRSWWSTPAPADRRNGGRRRRSSGTTRPLAEARPPRSLTDA